MKNIKIMENFHFNCLQGMYFSKIQPFEHGLFLSSDVIEDSYYNYCAPTKMEGTPLAALWEQIKAYFATIGRVPSVYVTPSCDLYGSVIRLPGVQKAYTDAWMVLDTPDILTSFNPNEQIAVLKIDSPNDFSVFVETFREAYSGDNPDDPYANLSPTYVQALKNSYKLTNSFTRHNYLATLSGIPIGVATAIEANGVVAVYNVGTITRYRKSGIGKALMSRITKDFINAQILFLQTEYGSYVENWYRSMGYKTVFLGECYSLA